jgi:hypothetical protein
MSDPGRRNTISQKRKSPVIKRPRAKPRLRFSCDERRPKTTSRTQQDDDPAWEEDPEMRSLRERLYENQDFTDIDRDTLDALFCSLREYAHQQGGKTEYDEALRAAQLWDAVRAELRARNPIRDPSAADAPEAEEAAFESQWRKRFDEFDQESESRLERLRKEQSDAMGEFERIWREEMPRQYRKPSTRLLNLRRIEKCLAIRNEFDQARAVHRDAEAIAASEWTCQQANLVRDYQVARAKLLSRLGRAQMRLHQTIAHDRDVLQYEYEREKVAVTNRSFVIDVKQKEIEKGYRTANRSRDAVGRGGGFAPAHDKAGIEDVLLAPLKPPSELADEETRKKRENDRRKQELQKQNAELALKKLRLGGKAPEQGGQDARPPQQQTASAEEMGQSIAVKSQLDNAVESQERGTAADLESQEQNDGIGESQRFDIVGTLESQKEAPPENQNDGGIGESPQLETVADIVQAPEPEVQDRAADPQEQEGPAGVAADLLDAVESEELPAEQKEAADVEIGTEVPQVEGEGNAGEESQEGNTAQDVESQSAAPVDDGQGEVPDDANPIVPASGVSAAPEAELAP